MITNCFNFIFGFLIIVASSWFYTSIFSMAWSIRALCLTSDAEQVPVVTKAAVDAANLRDWLGEFLHVKIARNSSGVVDCQNDDAVIHSTDWLLLGTMFIVIGEIRIIMSLAMARGGAMAEEHHPLIGDATSVGFPGASGTSEWPPPEDTEGGGGESDSSHRKRERKAKKGAKALKDKISARKSRSKHSRRKK